MSGKLTKKSNFTAVPNKALHNKNLSWKAKGLLSYLLSLPEDWAIYKKDLKNRSTDGYDGMLSGFLELEQHGYIETVRCSEEGLFGGGVDYIIHDSPIREFTDSGKSITGNPELIHTTLKKDKETRKKEFKERVLAYLKTEQRPQGYDRAVLAQFFDYWTETSAERKTFRFESEPYFDMAKRLSRFRPKQETTPKQQNFRTGYQGGEVGN